MKTEYNGLTITGTPEEMFAFANIITPKEEPKLEPVKKRAPALKKALDMGKVRALRKAGWTFDKIADEMGVSPQTIANRLKGEE